MAELSTIQIEQAEAVLVAISIAGSASKIAEACGVTVQAVCFWRDGLRKIPAQQCMKVEQLTDGRVTCEELRRDLDWSYLRAPSKLKGAGAGANGKVGA